MWDVNITSTQSADRDPNQQTISNGDGALIRSNIIRGNCECATAIGEIRGCIMDTIFARGRRPYPNTAYRIESVALMTVQHHANEPRPRALPTRHNLNRVFAMAGVTQ